MQTVCEPNPKISNCSFKNRAIFENLKYKNRKFSDSPVIKTLHFHCRGWGFDPWSGNYDPTCLAVRPSVCVCICIYVCVYIYITCTYYIYIYTIALKVLIAQSCPTFCDPLDHSPPVFFVHGILQARILEWVAIPYSRGSFQSRDWTWVSCNASRYFTVWATGEAHIYIL